MRDPESLIKKKATKLRHILDTQRFNLTRLSQFPMASCQATSTILGIYLFNKNIQEIKLVHGSRKNNHESHVWLVRGELIIDITADQFRGEGQSNVVVTSNSPWHNKNWKRGAILPIENYADLNSETWQEENFEETYHTIKKLLDQ
jgi:hypothetical protein